MTSNNSEPKVLPETGFVAQDPSRPQPRVVTPGTNGAPPSDAIILFDGTNLNSWKGKQGGEPRWNLVDGAMEVAAGTGGIVSKDEFGDIQLHIEFASPAEVRGEGQGRGNSGVFLMDRYEVQVLDNFENPTYSDGTVGAIYCQWPPDVNAINPPGHWNTFDILWTAPRFDGNRLVSPAWITVMFNGIVIHNHRKVFGPTTHKVDQVPYYIAHPPKGPIALQDHGDPVRFRNIWVRQLDFQQ